MPKTTNVRAILIEGEGSFEKIRLTPGAFTYTTHQPDENGPVTADAGIVHSCPCGCGSLCGIGLKPPAYKVLWEITGPRDAPTLSPSVGIRPWADDVPREADDFHWHGWLRNGVWETA